MSRAARRLDDYMRGNVFGQRFVEAQLAEHVGNVLTVSLGIGIEGLGLAVKLFLVDRAAGFEPVVPDVVRAQVTSQTAAYLGCNGFDLLRTKQLSEETVHLGCGNLDVALEVADDGSGHVRAVFVLLLHGVEDVQNHLITSVGLGLVGGVFHAVGDGIPKRLRVVDDRFGNLLADDAEHDVVYHLLTGVRLQAVGVMRFDFVAQVPMAEQQHAVGEELPAILGAEPIHTDVVVGYVVLGVGIGLREVG